MEKKKKKRKWLKPAAIVVGVIIVILIVRGIFFSGTAPAAQATVDAAPLIKSDIAEIVSASGSVYSDKVRNVYSTLSYPVQEIMVEAGDTVKAGDVLAVLDTENLEYDIAQAELNLSSAQSTYEDSRVNVASNITSAENSVKSAKISLEKQELNYKTLSDESGEDGTELLSAQNQIDSAQDTATNAKMSIDTAKASRDDAQKDLEDKHKTLEASEALFEVGLISQSELDTARNNADKSEGELLKAENNLASANISYEAALKNLDKAQKNAESTKASVNKNLVNAAKDLESARVSYQSALDALNKARAQGASDSSLEGQKLSLEKLREQLQDATIKAPVDGMVTEVSAVVGSNPNGAVFVIQDVSDLYIKTTVKEYNLAEVEIGQKALITTDATEDEVIMGEVSYISPVAVSEAGTTSVEFEVRAKLITPPAKVKVGMNAYINIVVDSRSNVFSVPSDAIILDAGKKYILALEDGRQDRIEVETGLETATAVEITGGGLKEGLTVIRNPAEVGDMDLTGMTQGAEGFTPGEGSAGSEDGNTPQRGEGQQGGPEGGGPVRIPMGGMR